MNTADLFYTVKEVQELCGYSPDAARKLIHKLNKEQADKGMITLKGKVLKSYFHKRVGDIPKR